MSCRKSVAALALSALLISSTTLAAGLENRIDSVNKLLSISSAAQKVLSSDNDEAKALLEDARAKHEQASELYAAGNEEEAKKALSIATTTLFKAAKLADGGAAVKEKKRGDYERRKETYNALLKQHQNIAEEKDVTDEAGIVEAETLAIVAQAEVKAGDDDYPGARKLLDQAYNQLKGSVIKMRDGEQLVMSLNFETPKDEYEYYVTKITSQREALSMVMAGNISKGRKYTVNNILKRADPQQQQAETLADDGNYEEAIPLMDSVLNKLRSGLMMVVR